jgi:hypothetical protein
MEAAEHKLSKSESGNLKVGPTWVVATVKRQASEEISYFQPSYTTLHSALY